MFTVESAKARRLKNELAECKSNYANLEAMADEAERLHVGTLSAMEAKYVSQVSSLEDELRSAVAAGRAAYSKPVQFLCPCYRFHQTSNFNGTTIKESLATVPPSRPTFQINSNPSVQFKSSSPLYRVWRGSKERIKRIRE